MILHFDVDVGQPKCGNCFRLDIREKLLQGEYKPQPVKQVLLPKKGGGTRTLGIPTVLDRFIQQALLQVLNSIYDSIFSDHSYGFRPGRNAHQAVKQAKKYIEEGKGWLGYYRLIEASYVLEELDWWIRRRMRCFVMNQWIKKCSARYNGLRNLGVSDKNTLSVAFSRKGPWVISNMKPVKVAMPNSFFTELSR